MRGSELLESRRLFAVLVPDVGWADDGQLRGETIPAPYGDYQYDSSTYAGQSGGRILVKETSGGGDYGEFPATTLQRIRADGTPDPQFHRITYFDIKASQSAVDTDASGRLVVAVNGSPFDSTNSQALFHVVRYTPTGRRDKAFAASLGFNRPSGERNIQANPRVVQALPDGSVAVLVDVTSYGRTTHVYSRRTELVKFNADGTLDTQFGRNGRMQVATKQTDRSNITTLLADPNGWLYLQTPTTVTRLVADGSAAQAFGDTTGATALLDKTGRLILVRATATGATVARYLDNGTPDPAFAGDGSADVVTRGRTGGVIAAVTDSDTIVVQSRREIFRVDANGSVSATGDTSSLPLIAVTADGRYLARGDNSPTRLRAETSVALGATGKIYIRTGDASDDVDVRVTDSTRVRVTLNGRASYFAKGSVKSIDATIGGGNNRFTSSLRVATHVVADAGRDTVTTGSGLDDIYTGRGSDVIRSGGGGDTIWPGAGNNTIDLGTTADDIETYTNIYAPEEKLPGVNLIRGRGGNLSINIGGAATMDLEFVGRSASVTVENSTGDNRIRLFATRGCQAFGGQGSDLIITGDGDDVVWGGGGSDTLRTGAGDDELEGGDIDPEGDVDSMGVSNILDGGPGHDRYRLGSRLDRLIEVEELETL